jgi:hypothetical protein
VHSSLERARTWRGFAPPRLYDRSGSVLLAIPLHASFTP